MKDTYPDTPGLDPSLLVQAQGQPEYDAPGLPEIGEFANIGVYLSDRQVERGHRDVPALIDAANGNVVTFAQLSERSTALAKGLVALGVQPGDRVAYRSPNVSDLLVVMCAIWKSGAVVTPIPVQATADDVAYYLRDTGARFLMQHPRGALNGEIHRTFADTRLEKVILFGVPEGYDSSGFSTEGDLVKLGADARLPRTRADQVGLLWHTGGTTGRPKGCYHTHGRYLSGGFSIGLAMRTEPGYRWAAAAPLGHALGIICNTIFTLLQAGTAVLLENYADPGALLQAVERHRVNSLAALTASWAKMLQLEDAGPTHDLSSLRRAFAMWQSASAADVYDGWKKRGVELLNNFGSTSFATWIIVPELGTRSPRAALGRACPGYTVAAVKVEDGRIAALPDGEIGQMAVRGPTGLTYWNRPELQARDVVDGWTLSDDLIRFDENGNIHYLGRTDFIISTGGYKVAPVEVEEVLSRHSAVREVSVVPGPSATHQEMVVAYVALNVGYASSDFLKQELREFAKTQLVSYKCPRRIEFIDRLPRDPVGKVQTRFVKEWASASA